MATKKKSAKTPQAKSSSANLGFESKLWLAADKLRGTMDSGEYKHVVLGLGRRFLRRRPELGSAAKCWHEIVRPVGVLTFAAMDVRKRCADLPETKICTCIRHPLEPGKRHPFGHLLTA